MSNSHSNKRRLYQSPADDEQAITVAEPEAKRDDRVLKAKEIILKSARTSAPNGIVPIPLLNYSTLAYIQARMIKKIATLYHQNTSLKDIKKIVTILISCYVSEFFANTTILRSLRALPGLGTIIGVGISSSLYYYSTKIVGELFLQHFESGGTILSFDPDGVKRYYSGLLQEAMEK